MTPAETWLRDVYLAFNARDIEAVLGVLHPDVDGPNGMEGGRVHGREAVRAYWTRQWAMVDPRVDPVGVDVTSDGRFTVDVHQVVHDLAGALLIDTHPPRLHGRGRSDHPHGHRVSIHRAEFGDCHHKLATAVTGQQSW